MFSNFFIKIIIIPETTRSFEVFWKKWSATRGCLILIFSKNPESRVLWYWNYFLKKIQNQRLFENSNNHTTLVPTYPPTKVPTLPTYLPTYPPKFFPIFSFKLLVGMEKREAKYPRNSDPVSTARTVRGPRFHVSGWPRVNATANVSQCSVNGAQ